VEGAPPSTQQQPPRRAPLSVALAMHPSTNHRRSVTPGSAKPGDCPTLSPSSQTHTTGPFVVIWRRAVDGRGGVFFPLM
jgi:hypothetical protein